jgi:hypothetical protein
MAIAYTGFNLQDGRSLSGPAVSGLGQHLKVDFGLPWRFDI